MVSTPIQPEQRSHTNFDWIDILLAFVTLGGAFALASALDASQSSGVFKYGTAAAIVVVVVLRRAILGPPRVAAVGTRRSVLGVTGAICMFFGLIIASLGGYLLLGEWKKPIEATRIDHAAIEKQIGISALQPSCLRNGQQLRGRECRTAEELAREAAADEQIYADEVARLTEQKQRQVSSLATVTGVGVVLVLLGIALDILRSRRDRATARIETASVDTGEAA